MNHATISLTHGIVQVQLVHHSFQISAWFFLDAGTKIRLYMPSGFLSCGHAAFTPPRHHPFSPPALQFIPGRKSKIMLFTEGASENLLCSMLLNY